MLNIEFMSGVRRGEVESLAVLSKPSKSPCLQIREDDVIKFTVALGFKARVRLVLHEIQMYATNVYRKGDSWIYEWMPGCGEYRYNCFFLNYYGVAALDLVIEKIDCEDSDGGDFLISNQNAVGLVDLIELQEIEVLAKSANAERVNSMIGFIAKQDPALIASVFRVTRLRAGYNDDNGRSDSQYLDRVERNIKELDILISNILKSPITRAAVHDRIVVPGEQFAPDEFSISWLIGNASELFKTDDPYHSLFEVNGEHYSAPKIAESYVSSKTDCYENRVVHGYIAFLKSAIRNILLSIEGRVVEQSNKPPQGYESFFTQIHKYTNIINKNKIDRCERLDSRLTAIMANVRRLLPVANPAMGIPLLTAKAKNIPAYRELFFRMMEFMRFGRPDWSINDALLSITSIPKLFEYYCLFLVRSKIENIIGGGNIGSGAPMEITENLAKFSYGWGELTINLFYEPSYWMAGHPNALLAELVNTEGWTRNQLDGKGKVAQSSNQGYGRRSNSSKWSRRTPDIVIQIEASGKPTQICIIDAKYTSNKKAFLEYLPELTMKYVHGIHEQETGRNQTVAMMIINPSSEPMEQTRHYHADAFSIFGDTPVEPALLVSSIDFLIAESDCSEVSRNIEKLLKLMIKKLHRDEKCKKILVAA